MSSGGNRMLLLGIDTCGSSGTVAFVRLEIASREGADKFTLLAQTELAGKTYSAQLVPSIRNLLAGHQASLGQLGAIVITSGPGSFTGIRIGLSTAKGLAEPRATPILAVSRLAVLAWKGEAEAAALDASRDEFYCGDYSDVNCGGAESLMTREQFVAKAATPGSRLVVCEAAVLAVAASAALVDPPTAADALQFALGRLRAGDFDDPLLLDGNYIRRSDAEIFSKPGAGQRPSSTAP
jgi:tRNA threonylcarbamoyladenosine biosynthesis protein TsaB